MAGPTHRGHLPRHYARESDSEDPLPASAGRRPGDQQAWSPKQRDRLTRHIDERASAAIDAFGAVDVPASDRGDLGSEAVRQKADAWFTAYKRCRERALAYIL